jgi:hypothetical protein
VTKDALAADANPKPTAAAATAKSCARYVLTMLFMIPLEHLAHTAQPPWVKLHSLTTK